MWEEFFEQEKHKNYYTILNKYLDSEFKNKEIYPSREKIFNFMRLCDNNSLKVVIIGQDPYHNEQQANGLCFSVNNDIKLPPSLKNIFKEIYNQTGIQNTNGDLVSWANQGILLMNSILTVEKNKPASHSKIGWQLFTDNLIKYINKKFDNIIYLLWGNYAIEKAKFVDINNNFVLTSAHPSPFSANRGFYGNEHFNMTNDILKKLNKTEIDWKTY